MYELNELRTKRKMQLLGTGNKQETLDKDMDIDALSLVWVTRVGEQERQGQQCMYVCMCVCADSGNAKRTREQQGCTYSCSAKW